MCSIQSNSASVNFKASSVAVIITFQTGKSLNNTMLWDYCLQSIFCTNKTSNNPILNKLQPYLLFYNVRPA